MKTRIILIALLLSLSLGGCASRPAYVIEPSPPSSGPNALTAAPPPNWRIKAKLAVSAAARKSANATLLWDYFPGRQMIEVYGPFGGERVRIDVNAQRTLLRAVDGDIVAPNASDALQQRLGWRVPFEKLRYWLFGLPAESFAEEAGASSIDSPSMVSYAGKIQTMRDGDWQIDYLEYRRVGELDLPYRMQITSLPGRLVLHDEDGEYLGDWLRIKLLIKHRSDAPFGG